MNQQQQAAHLLNTTFSVSIRGRCSKAIKRYRLIAPGDRIAVCISGGKDSLLLAVLLRELSQHGDIPFSLCFLAMDPGYAPPNREKLLQNAQALGLPLQLFETNVFRVSQRHAKNPCFLCAKMRRGYLYAQAQALGCNKIALGHHYDDAVETTLMGMLYGGQVQAMQPRVRAAHYAGMELIRPLYDVQERDIIAWRDALKLECLGCACAVAGKNALTQSGSKRAEIKALIASLSAHNPQIRQNILNSVKNVDVRKVLGWRDSDTLHTFLDHLEEEP